MTQLKFRFLLALTIVVGASGVAVSQSRIQLAQGRRAIQDKVSFVVDVVRDKRNDPRNAVAPDDMMLNMRFADRPATGRVYIDGKAIGRFDESGSFNSNLLDVTYGRHTITVAFANPSLMLDFYVTIRGGMAREILDDHEPVVNASPSLETRIVELERKVHDLENEIAGLKKKRHH